jgi:hypothetical protein
VIESTEPVPLGHVVLSASFEKEGGGMPTEGTLTLHMRDQAVGEGRIKTQPAYFSLAGEGLNVGKDGGEPVTDDYPGDSPWASSAERSIRRSSTSAASHSSTSHGRRPQRSHATDVSTQRDALEAVAGMERAAERASRSRVG